MDRFREQLGNMVVHPLSQRFVVCILLMNAATLGIETSPWFMGKYGHIILTLNDVFPIIFVIEVGRGSWRAAGASSARAGTSST